MVKCLRDNFLYSEKRARDILFDIVEGRIAGTGDSPMLLCTLTREASKSARRSADAVGFEFSNWDITTKAVVGAMLAAGVFIGQNGTVVPIGISAQATAIASLKRRFRDLTEAYLLEFLIKKLGDVTMRDHRALAHALFRQFDSSISMDDFEDRVAMLIATLADRVTLTEAGAYTFRKANSVSLAS